MKGSLTLGAMLLTSLAWSQLTYTDSPTQLGATMHSGGCMAVCDMDGDGLDDITILDNSEHVYIKYQKSDGTFNTIDYGMIDGSANPAGQWGWAIGDIDNNGHKDIVAGGSYDGTHYMRITSPGVFTVSDLDGPGIFTQSMSLGDLDNDGNVDVFACHDDGPPNIWFTNGSGVPVNNNAYIDWTTACTGTSGDMSGNYGSTFTDFDNDGDLDFHISHCRQGVNSATDCRRWDRLFVNDGTNHYSDEAATYGLENHEQVWTSDFGDYDNDGDMDVVSTTHSLTMMLFNNDGTGHYTDVTAGSGIEVSGFFLQSLFRDFDNDGFLDIITASAQYYFKGDGSGVFTEELNPFPVATTMHTFAIGDLNNDGFEDVYAGYGGGYIDPGSEADRLWLATPNGNHWFRARLKGTVSNEDAIGARISIYGPFGVKIREVHAGESYGIVNSFAPTFGIGSFTSIDSVVINWPSGIVDTYSNPLVDETTTFIEDVCIAPIVSITTPGDPIVCTGGSPIVLTANPGFNYTWSTGPTTQSISVSAGGSYAVTIDDGTGCYNTTSILVSQDPDVPPTITAGGDLIFCAGGSVTLTSSASASYQWSGGGGTGQSATVSAAGSYTVTTQGFCGNIVSDPVVVNVLAIPAQPTAFDAYIPTPNTVDLTASGANIHWYSDAGGATEVGVGSPWTTPVINTMTSFWCGDVNQVGGDQYYGGKTDNDAVNGQYLNNTSVYMLFTAFEDMVIKSVKVYAQGASNRTIALVDETNGNTLAQGTYMVPDGESRVDLDFFVPQGGAYGLRILTGTSLLWRDGDGTTFNFPYALGTLGEVFQSNATGANTYNRWYFFFDWEVETPKYVCTSPLEEVVVHLGVGISEAEQQGVHLFPNPASTVLNITVDGSLVNATVTDVTGRVVAATFTQVNASEAKLDISTLAPGQYMVRAELGDRIVILPVQVR